MKTGTLKATIILGISLLGAPASFAGVVPFPTPSPVPSPGPGDAAEEIRAQMAITRRGVDNLLSTIGRNSPPEAYKLKDYFQATPKFKKDVETALVHFEETLKREILEGMLAGPMTKYNSLAKSNAFSESQKALLLLQQKADLDRTATEASIAYAKAAGKATAEAGIPIYDVRSKDRFDILADDWNRFATVSRCSDFDCAKKEKLGRAVARARREVKEYADDEIRKDLLDGLRTECRSQLCVILRASDILSAIEELKGLFGRAIQMNLADGSTVTLGAPDLSRIDETARVLKASNQFDIRDLPLDAE